MPSILSSQVLLIATAMAVSGTVIFLAFCRQKPLSATQSAIHQNFEPTSRILRSCISSTGNKREKKKKRVHFADDVVDPNGNNEEFMRQQRENSMRFNQVCRSESNRVQEMPANRMALYNGILRDRV